MMTTWGLVRLGTPELGRQHNLRPSRQGWAPPPGDPHRSAAAENPAALTPAQDSPSAARSPGTAHLPTLAALPGEWSEPASRLAGAVHVVTGHMASTRTQLLPGHLGLGPTGPHGASSPQTPASDWGTGAAKRSRH
ncbi:unnamed protein product [Rangifer tarandus platyrhynchus]|uniref:Uncharacterized protein n=1 Tax=Rangifer tarandus platyrhynchus TaxID=3082113 RepID=A0AC59YJQ1_RANTA